MGYLVVIQCFIPKYSSNSFLPTTDRLSRGMKSIVVVTKLCPKVGKDDGRTLPTINTRRCSRQYSSKPAQLSPDDSDSNVFRQTGVRIGYTDTVGNPSQCQ